MEYLCKLIQVDLFGGGNFRPQKILENGILFAEFPSAAYGFPKMLADFILDCNRHICPSENNRN